MNYEEFLASKTPKAQACGREVEDSAISKKLFEWQRVCTRWACRLGRAAFFWDCGLGKSFGQTEWLRLMSGGDGLIVAPLSVGKQTIRQMREHLGIELKYVTEPESGLCVTNYERLESFRGHKYRAVVMDESSILAGLDSKTRGLANELFCDTPFRLCCTATPHPNDVAELANHAEFLGVATRAEVLATFFVHDQDGWRLRGHAQDAFYEWLASWAMSLKSPADIGYDATGYNLPPLNIREVMVDGGWKRKGEIFGAELKGITDRANERKQTVAARVAAAVDIARSKKTPCVVWCGLNSESESVAAALGDECVEVTGSMPSEKKEALILDFVEGRKRILVTKPDICGYGMNFQHCHRTVFVGLSDSYQDYYQCIRRFYRYGQTEPVDVAIVVTDAEGSIVSNVKRKEAEAEKISGELIERCKVFEQRALGGERAVHYEYKKDERSGEGWRMLLGDSIERIKEIETGSVGLSVFSPPFASLYTYSASPRDMGNCKDYDQFFAHFSLLLPELRRITMNGRRACVHVQQVTTTKVTHGVIGWRDFRADAVKAFIAAGWVYDGEVVIDKDPQAQAIRTKSKALMFVQKNKDSLWSRPAMADYILLFRHPKDNEVPVETDVSNEEWIQWARPIWYGIRESETLSAQEAREEKDEKHTAPLQLETIQRCVRLWSNPGELVFSPFGGIGSEPYQALMDGRRGLAIELKESYWRIACKNLERAAAAAKRKDKNLFANMETPQ